MKKYCTLAAALTLATARAQTTPPPPEVENGFFYEQGYGQSLGSGVPQNEEGMDLAFNGNQRLMAGWEENTNGIKELSLWGIAANNELNYQTKQAAFTPEYDRVATGIVFQDGTSYLISTETAQYTGTVQAGDLGVLSAIDEDGILQWEVVLPPNGLLPKDILNYQDHLYILANQYDMGGGNRGLQLFKYDLNGNQIWMRNYTGKSGQNISATELVLDQNGFTTVGNNVTFGPEIVQWDFNGSLLQFNTPLNTGYQLFGIARDAATGNLVAAGHNGTPGSQDAVVSHFGRQGTDYAYLQDYGYDDHGTDESFHDLILHSQGITAVGKVDNSDIGEGQAWDGLGVLFDAGGNVIQNQPAGGGTQDDYMNVIVKQSDEYAYVAGYNQVFTIDASGNAWQLGFRNYNSSGASTTLPRYMYVDMIDNGALDWENDFDTKTKREQVADDAKANNITKLFLFNVELLINSTHWDSNCNTSGCDCWKSSCSQSCTCMKNQMIDFVKYANSQGIDIGWAMGADFNKMDFVANEFRELNYNTPSKFRFGILEHEFWNARLFSSNIDGSETNPLGANPTATECQDFNDNFIPAIKQDHLNLLDKLENLKHLDCNNWHALDAVRFNWVLTPGDCGSLITYDHGGGTSGNSQVNREQMAEDIAKRADAILLLYYRTYNHPSRSDNTFPSTDEINYDWVTNSGFVNRLEEYNLAAQNLTKDVNIVPLFSAEGDPGSDPLNPNDDINNDPINCNTPGSEHFLYDWLVDNNLTYNLQSAEEQWIKNTLQTKDAYESFYSANPSIQDVKISGFAWFTYNCAKGAGFGGGTNNLVTFDPQKGNYDPGFLYVMPTPTVKEALTKNGDFTLSQPNTYDRDVKFEVFPNPTNRFIQIHAPHSITRITLRDLRGALVKEYRTEGRQEILQLENLDSGAYLLQVFTEGNPQSETFKVIYRK